MKVRDINRNHIATINPTAPDFVQRNVKAWHQGKAAAELQHRLEEQRRAMESQRKERRQEYARFHQSFNTVPL